MGLVEEQLSAVQGQVVSVAGFWSTILKILFWGTCSFKEPL